ncbi:prepilin-type N-terminal cleavage/methylation domain-containing protein [bacterium]|nr:prepilin-type N-terminal cleavage/methylation domain-containing protein [bacterium]
MLTGGGSCKPVESTLSDDLGSLEFKVESGKLVLPSPNGRRQGEGADKKAAFTLAEVLITLGIIGVVAAITLPTIMVNVTERINSTRQANIAYKVTQAMEMMRAHGLLNHSYDSTESFVDELQKYLKTAKRCDSSHIADCWATEKVTTADGEEFEVSDAKTGKNLSVGTTTNNVGLVLADGGAIILNYNPATQGLDVGDGVEAQPKSLPVGFGKNQDFVYTTSVTVPIDFVMDVNGGKGPNSEVAGRARDIRSFKIAQFSEGGPDCTKYPNSFYVEDVGCVVNVGTSYSYIDTYSTSSGWDTSCKANSSVCKQNRWAGANAKCASLNDMHLTDLDELNKLFKRNCSDSNPYYNASTCISDIPTSDWQWSSTADDAYQAKIKLFSNGAETSGSKNATGGALCVGN